VVRSGDQLPIDFREGRKTQPSVMTTEKVQELEPSDQVDRAINIGIKIS